MEEYLLVVDEEAVGEFVGGIYFHGKLENDLHYDLVNVVGSQLYRRIVSDIEKNIDTHVLVNNEFKPVKMVLWVSELNQKRGLICYEDDLESIA